MATVGGARFMLRDPAHWVAFGFGSGLSPWAPGTVGTLWGWASFLALDPWLGDAGWAILVVSEGVDGLFEISDRLVVIARGRLSPALPVGQATVEQIGSWMSGLWSQQAQEASRAEA